MFPAVFFLPKPGAKLSTVLHVGQVMWPAERLQMPFCSQATQYQVLVSLLLSLVFTSLSIYCFVLVVEGVT